MSYGVHPYAVAFDRLPSDSSLDGYGLESALAGRFLTNRRWSAMRMSWFDTVDEALKAVGCPTSLSRFFMRGAPVPIIPPDDFPMVGHFPPGEVVTLGAQLREAAKEMDGEPYDAVVEVLGWLDGLRPGEGIVTFYY